MKPNTRKEMFLDAIADGEPCNLVPANRKELLLQRMAENAGGGGGMTIIAFEITADGNGGYNLTKASHSAKEICDFVKNNASILFVVDHYSNGQLEKKELTVACEYQPPFDNYSESVSIGSKYLGGNVIANADENQIWAEMN